MEKRNYKEVFDFYWRHIVINEKGRVKLDQMKRELSDYSLLMDNVARVYNAYTPYSKPFTDPERVIEAIQESFYDEKQDAWEDLGATTIRHLGATEMEKIKNLIKESGDEDLISKWEEVAEQYKVTSDRIGAIPKFP